MSWNRRARVHGEPQYTRAIVLFFTALSAAAAGCATQTADLKGHGENTGTVGKQGAAADLQVFYPLAIGNQWTYKGTLLGQPQVSKVTITSQEGPVFVDDKGGKLMFDKDGLRDSKRYLLKAPAVRGTSWVSVTALTSTEHFEIIDDARKVTVPAGTFNSCLVVRAKNRIDKKKSLLTEWTFAPRVGIVRIETFLDKDDKEWVPQGKFELDSYVVKDAAK